MTYHASALDSLCVAILLQALRDARECACRHRRYNPALGWLLVVGAEWAGEFGIGEDTFIAKLADIGQVPNRQQEGRAMGSELEERGWRVYR